MITHIGARTVTWGIKKGKYYFNHPWLYRYIYKTLVFTKIFFCGFIWIYIPQKFVDLYGFILFMRLKSVFVDINKHFK